MTAQGLLPPSQLPHQQAFAAGQVGPSPFAINLPVSALLCFFDSVVCGVMRAKPQAVQAKC
jgi:hypothetical protein